MTHPMFERHGATLQKALEAIRARGYWSPYPESASPKNYGEAANADGKAAFEALLNKYFELDQPGTSGKTGKEFSPYGFALGITYPKADLDALLPAMKRGMDAWRDAGADARAGVCLEILQRLNLQSFLIAHSVMHTTGQGLMMAFQAAGPNAQDRGLEAVAYAYDEMRRYPERAYWEKPQGKGEPLKMQKSYRIMPRGIALVIGCSTFPTWNTYPGLFASLATGNAVAVKSHPGAILPAAVTVRTAREVLAEAGFDKNLVTLVADTAEEPVTKDIALRPEIRIIDFTGSSAFGTWLEENARQAVVFTEKAGVNSVIIDSTDNLQGMLRNLAFSLSLYSGQMCTAPQDIFVPKSGITADGGAMSFDEVAKAIGEAVAKFLADPERSAEIIGAIQSPATFERVDHAAKLGQVVLASEKRAHPQFPQARMRTPLILKVDAGEEDKYMQELFGPIAFIVGTRDTADSIERATRAAREHGAITCGVYSTDAGVLRQTQEAAAEAGVSLSCNLTGGVYVNQSAAFSDFHVSGANPAGNASLIDGAYVANRFRIAQSRIHV